MLSSTKSLVTQSSSISWRFYARKTRETIETIETIHCFSYNPLIEPKNSRETIETMIIPKDYKTIYYLQYGYLAYNAYIDITRI